MCTVAMDDDSHAAGTEANDRETEPPPTKKAKPSQTETEAPDVSRYRTWSDDKVLTFLERQLRTEPRITKGRCKELLHKLLGVPSEVLVTGKDLDKLTEENMLDVSIQDHHDASTIMDLVESLRQQQYRIYNDPVYGTIELHPLVFKIIDTPEFQRLRSIKQLGAGYLVYPGATHTRFEHSIGVCYLAGELARTLKRKQPELNITDKDILCVEIAGLCHDLGHGPFSHMFETYFMPKFNEATKDKAEWKHEKISAKVFDRIYWKRLKDEFEHYGLQDDKAFIEEQIEGRDPVKDKAKLQKQKKHFLYEIVANKRNGIDVDKWDYFARDCHYLGLTNSFQWRRALLLSRAVQVEQHSWQICTRDKEVENVYNFFYTRHMLRRRAYLHKTKSIAERMIAEALYCVRELPLIQVGKETLTIADVVSNIATATDPGDKYLQGFLKLTDEITHQVQCFPNDGLSEDKSECLLKAQDLLCRLQKRQLYKFIDSTTVPLSSTILEKDIAKEIWSENGDAEAEIHVEKVKFSWGSENDKNPVEDVRFYSKEDPWTAVTVPQKEVSPLVVPCKFTEVEIRVYDKKSKRDPPDLVGSKFTEWKNSLPK